MKRRGIFIALEGPDGSGKSTIAKKLRDYIESNISVKVVLTREPGGTLIGEDIRKVLLDNNNITMSSKTEALLYAAARAQHVNEKIEPLLEDGYIVISDRYVLSSLAYQGHARDLGIEEVMKINEFAMDGIYPDKVLFFDISPEEALKRKFINREADRLENEGEDFHRKTYEGYLKAIEAHDKNVSLIDANGTVEETLANCVSAIHESFNM